MLCYYFGDELVDAPSNQPFKASLQRPTHSMSTQVAMSRIQFGTRTTSTPLHSIIGEAQKLANDETAPLLVVAGRSRKPADVSFKDELAELMKNRLAPTSGKNTAPTTPAAGGGHHSAFPNVEDKLGIASSSEVRKCLGNVASSIVAMRLNVSLLIVQSRHGRPTEHEISA